MENDNLKKEKQCAIHGVMCSACGELIPEHEIYPAMLEMDADDIECVCCENKYRDSADIDNFMGC